MLPDKTWRYLAFSQWTILCITARTEKITYIKRDKMISRKKLGQNMNLTPTII